MKDAFFRMFYRLYQWVYRNVLYVTYYVIMHRMTKGYPSLSQAEKKQLQDYWKQYGVRLFSKDDYRWYKGKGLTLDPRLISEKLYHSRIEPHFTDLRLLDGFQDKNYFDTILNPDNAPKCVCRCVNGQLLDGNYAPLTAAEAAERIRAVGSEVICKPSMDTCGGKGIRFLSSDQIQAEDFPGLLQEFHKNFVVQELVRQHEFMNRFNPTSVNTFRVLTFLFEGEVHFLSGYVRVGAKGGKLDNVSAGGAYVPVFRDGSFGEHYLDYTSDTVDMQIPGIDLSMLVFPFWKEVEQVLTATHFKLAHFPLINWDVAIREDGVPVIIEYNLIDTDVFGHQISVGPLFGDLSDRVFAECFGKK